MMQLLNLVQSVLAAMFGVQSHAKHSRDFSTQKLFLSFSIVAIMFVLGLVLLLYFLVNYITAH